jgi:flagellin-like protein
MKKRGVSPVIATVLLIALVTAAAAIVFLVVIPMLQPNIDATLIATPNSSDAGGGNRAIEINIKALGGALNISSVTVTGVTGVEILDAPTGATVVGTVIEENDQLTVYVVGAFTVGIEYDITIEFDSISKTISHTA